MQDKAFLRQQAKKKQQQLSMAPLSQQIRHVVQSWSVFQQVKTVLAYVALPNEVDIMPLIVSYPEKTWVLPRIEGQGEMRFYHYQIGDMLEAGPMNISQPAVTAMGWDGSIEDTLILVPALMLDSQGYRLGYGGGFYDRFLAQYPVLSACLLPSALWTDALPKDTWDMPVQWGIDETRIVNFSNQD